MRLWARRYCPIWAASQVVADFRHRALRHHSEGIFWAEEVFGHTITNSDGKAVPVRFIGEQHVKEDLGWIPTLQDWFKNIRVQPWMAKSGDCAVARGEAAQVAPPVATATSDATSVLPTQESAATASEYKIVAEAVD